MRIQVKVSTCAKALRLEKQFVWKKKTKQNRDFPDGPVARIVEGLVQSLAGGPRSHKLHGEANKTKAKESLSAGGRVAEGNVS